MVVDISTVAPIIVFIASLFVLYRLLVNALEKNVALLKDELEYRQNYKSRLEEIQTFYKAEIDMFQKKLQQHAEDREDLGNNLAEAEGRKADIERALSDSQLRAGHLEHLLTRAHEDYMKRLTALNEENEKLREKMNDSKSQFIALCEKVKEKYGEHVLIELTEPNIREQLRLKARKNRELKHSNATTMAT